MIIRPFMLLGLLTTSVVAVTVAVVPTASLGALSCTVETDLARGAVSDEVRCLEERLSELGYPVDRPDRTLDPATVDAVLAYQRGHGLSVDGVVGERTATALALRGDVDGVVPAHVIETRVLGTSVEGRPIRAQRLGTPGGRVVLVVGVIHGDEQHGARVVRRLRSSPTPEDIDLWLVDSINPDGVAAGRRTNAHDVDLNRNFEIGWGYIARSTEHRQYSGEAPADQPETQVTQAFIREVTPALTVWFHQDLNTISGGGKRPDIAEAYAAATGMTISTVGCSQKCTGTAGAFVRGAVDGAANLLVELPGSDDVTAEMVQRHAAAVFLVAGL